MTKDSPYYKYPARVLFGTAMNYATKYANSYTQTKQRKKSQNNMSNAHTSVASARFSLTLNAKTYKGTKGQIKYNDSRAVLIDNSAGIQLARTLNVIGARNAWLFPAANPGLPSEFELGGIPLGYLGPNTNNSGGTYITASDPDSVTQQCLILKHVSLTYDFTNSTNTPNFITLYFVTPKFDTDRGPIDTWDDGYLEEDFGIGAGAINFPAAGLTGSTTSRSFNIQVGQTPMMTALFRKEWRILKKHKMELGAGSTEKLNVGITMNVKGDTQWLQKQTETYMANKTVVVFAVQHGAVVLDKTQVLTPIPTYSSSETGVCSQIRYSLCTQAQQKGRLNLQVGANHIPANTVPTNQFLMDTKDAVATVLEAGT